MPRSKPISVTHVSVTGSPLSENDKEQLIKLLTQRGLPRAEVFDFVSGINSAIVGAYRLTPAMSTNGERQKWLLKAQQAIIKARGALASADENQGADLSVWRSEDLQMLDLELFRFLRRSDKNNPDSPLLELLDRLATVGESRVKQIIFKTREALASADENHVMDISVWRSEDLQELDLELAKCIGLSDSQRTGSPLLKLLDRLATVCETRRSSLMNSKKTAGNKQQLANDLASAWRQSIKRKPTASISDNSDGVIKPSPFIEALRFTLTIMQKHSPNVDALRVLAERAIGSMKKRDEIASRYLKS